MINLDSIRDDSGRIYDLCGVARSLLDDKNVPCDNGLRKDLKAILREIVGINSGIYDSAVLELRRLGC